MFVLHSMDERGAILSTERLAGLSPQQLQRLAEERLKTFAMVEVCQGTRRVLFLERPTR
jgi:hypothetical protein